MAVDVRDVIPAVRVPTLVVQRVDDPIVHVENGRYLARHIEGVTYVELPGKTHVPWVDGGVDVRAEIRQFLTGAREASEPDRVLATILFTTSPARPNARQSSETGAGARCSRATTRRSGGSSSAFRGRELDTAGHGLLASFDGPARAIRCARAAVEAVRPLGLEIRAGVHTGECEVADGKPAGLAVHIGASVAAQARPGPGKWELYAVSGTGP